MIEISKVDISSLKKEGERRLSRTNIATVAKNISDRGNFLISGPGGYLSPSTIKNWMLCPHRVYLDKIEHAVPYVSALSAVFGSAYHEGMASTFDQYRLGNDIDRTVVYAAYDRSLATSLLNIFPKGIIYNASPTAVSEFVAEVDMSVDAQRKFRDMVELGIPMGSPIDIKDVLSIFEQTNMTKVCSMEGSTRIREFDGTDVPKLIKDIDKRKKDCEATLALYLDNKRYQDVGLPTDILGVEEDGFLDVGGVAVYYIADLVTSGGIYDHKYTTSAMIGKKAAAVPFDVQLWVYEMAYNRDAHLLLHCPPAKTERAKPRDLVTTVSRHNPDYPLLDDMSFVSAIWDIANCTIKGEFRKTGLSFLGGCGECAAHAACVAEGGSYCQINSEGVKTLHRKEAKPLNIKEIWEKALSSGDEDLSGLDMDE